ncbi:MAG: hypothetical protein FJW32_06900 [Acidobacteria bacterium]|nr:hypothetical protein [Acidobacteriota bacterium]
MNEMAMNLNCETARELLELQPYGELTFDQEEAVDLHVQICPACAAEKRQIESMHAVLDRQSIEPSYELLAQCRQNLRRSVAVIAGDDRPVWRRWIDSFTLSNFAKPVFAMGLLAAGFFGARLMPPAEPVAAPVARNVRFIEPGTNGAVRIGYDEVRQRSTEGRIDDRGIQDLLLAAAANPDDPGLRVDSVEVLKSRVELEDVRGALIRALEADTNEGVRLKALEALKPYLGERDVRAALTRSLVADQSPVIRTQAIDLLVSSRPAQQELTGVLQDLMRREQNAYIRQKSQTALRAMKASLETF